MKPPSFEPWVGRVRVARIFAAALGCVLVSTLSYAGGMGWDDAIGRGLVAAVACYFVGWAAALWICGELYAAEINRIKQRIHERELEKQRQLEQILAQRAEMTGGMPMNDSLDATQRAPMQPPPMRDAA